MKKLFFGLMTATTLVAGMTSCDKKGNEPVAASSEELKGAITGVKTLDPAKEYLITGPVLVQDGATLNIPAGTVIKAKRGFENYVLVLQGGKINANGTAEKPVVFTADIKNPKAGYWGGLIINGKAPLSGGETGTTEINASYKYGGTDPQDNSGVLTYVKLEYTGAKSGANVEHNGLTLNGVGAGTTINNLYIPYTADDAVEFFGGTVNVENLLAVDSDDDMFDFTQGYKGTLKNAYGVWQEGYKSTEKDPRGVEADGNLDGNHPEQQGQSDFTIENMTIDLQLAPSTDEKMYMHDVVKVRRGAKATVKNALVKGNGTAKDLVDLTDKKGVAAPGTHINLKSELSSKILGKEANLKIEIEDKKTKTKKVLEAKDVTIENGANTGCDKALFSWTGYKIK